MIVVVLLMISVLVVFSFSILGNSFVMNNPINMTMNGCMPCVMKETRATDASVPARVEKTSPNELSISLIRFRLMTFVLLVWKSFEKDLRYDFINTKINRPTRSNVILDHKMV